MIGSMRSMRRKVELSYAVKRLTALLSILALCLNPIAHRAYAAVFFAQAVEAPATVFPDGSIAVICVGSDDQPDGHRENDEHCPQCTLIKVSALTPHACFELDRLQVSSLTDAGRPGGWIPAPNPRNQWSRAPPQPILTSSS